MTDFESTLPLAGPAAASFHLPLLLAYADPLGRLAAPAHQSAGEHDAALLTVCPGCSTPPVAAGW
ncbi:MAG: hypothetical protein ACKO45_11145 [Cyanobium sp.]